MKKTIKIPVDTKWTVGQQYQFEYQINRVGEASTDQQKKEKIDGFVRDVAMKPQLVVNGYTFDGKTLVITATAMTEASPVAVIVVAIASVAVFWLITLSFKEARLVVDEFSSAVAENPVTSFFLSTGFTVTLLGIGAILIAYAVVKTKGAITI